MIRNHFTLVSSLLWTLLLIITGCGDENNPVAPVPDPVASFSYSGSTVTPAQITFINQSENADRFYWDFGDGRTSIQTNPVITFQTAGTFTTMLIASSSATSKADTATGSLTLTPGSVFLQSVTIIDIPWLDGAGGPWDNNGTGPDLQLFVSQSGNALLESGEMANVTENSFPIRLNVLPEYLLTDWSNAYRFDLYDNDPPFSPEHMGYTSFNVRNIISSRGYVNEYQMTSGRLIISVTLRWQ